MERQRVGRHRVRSCICHHGAACQRLMVEWWSIEDPGRVGAILLPRRSEKKTELKLDEDISIYEYQKSDGKLNEKGKELYERLNSYKS